MRIVCVCLSGEGVRIEGFVSSRAFMKLQRHSSTTLTRMRRRSADASTFACVRGPLLQGENEITSDLMAPSVG